MKKERPILFSGEMVRAILDGRKTQTRRLAKFEAPACIHDIKKTIPTVKPLDLSENLYAIGFKTGDCVDSITVKCPYGKVGDRLWVRENFRISGTCGGHYEDSCDCEDFTCEYEADGHFEHFDTWDSESKFPKMDKWRPSLFMPRFLSRITLEITNVRVERLNEISDADCGAEGIHADFAIQGQRYSLTPKEKFMILCESINGAESWDKNPWVWVVEFKRV